MNDHEPPKPAEAFDYDAAKDFAGSLDEGYRAIREGKGAGHPNWTIKNQTDRVRGNIVVWPLTAPP